MLLSTLVSDKILLGTTQLVNLFSATIVFGIGVYVFSKDRKSAVNQLFLLIAFFLCQWAFTSTMSDVMHEYVPALAWAKLAIIGPFWFSALLHVFAHYFPVSSRRPLPWWKTASILFPSIVALLLIDTPLNIESVRVVEWGTDFTPGLLYVAGIPFVLANIGFAGAHFIRASRSTKDLVVKKQMTLIFLGVSLVLASLILTNAVLPALGYAQASVFGPAASLFFVILTSYAIVRHRLLDTKVIATEILTFVLFYLAMIQVFRATDPADAALRVSILAATLVFGVLLIRSVNDEVRRREELQELSGKLKVANAELKELDAARTEFLSIASHQLRTPIAVIKGYLSLLGEGAYGPIGDGAKQKVSHMAEMNDRLAQTINNLLNASRIEKRKIEYLCAPVGVDAVLATLAEDMQFRAEQSGVTFAIATPSGPLPDAYCDANKLREVLSNLIDNAFKYTPRGGKVTVAATALPDNGGVQVAVSDTGVGLTPEQQKKLFSRYYRAHNKKTEGVAGTGIGLFIAKTFVEGMGGKIWIAQTAPDKGTTFAFTLLPYRPKRSKEKRGP